MIDLAYFQVDLRSASVDFVMFCCLYKSGLSFLRHMLRANSLGMLSEEILAGFLYRLHGTSFTSFHRGSDCTIFSLGGFAWQMPLLEMTAELSPPASSLKRSIW
jgi:hypothetical protein